MLNSSRSHIIRFLFPAMMFLSLIMGVFISFYFIFVNDQFPREVGVSRLSYAFIASGFLGYGITYIYNRTEVRLGFMRAATLYTAFFALCIGLIWVGYHVGWNRQAVIFLAYTWFWMTSNFLNLVFWKIPALYFDLGETKQYNGWISTGEVLSSILAYSLVFQFTFSDQVLLAISGSSMLGFLLVFLMIRLRLANILPKSSQKKAPVRPKISLQTVWKNDYFKFISGAIFFSIVIQLLVDYSLLDATAHEMKDVKERKAFLAFWYMIMRIMEFVLKTVISRIIIKELGLFVGLISIISALSLIVLGGVITLTSGISGSIVIFSTLNKVLERSIFRSIYAPTINVLYQAYPLEIRSVSQNYADGYGKTIGQITAGLLILILSQLQTYNTRILLVFLLISVILLLWYLVSRNLIRQYREELKSLISRMKVKINESPDKAGLPSEIRPVPVLAHASLKSLLGTDLFEKKAGKNLASFQETERLWLRSQETFRYSRNESFTNDQLIACLQLHYFTQLPEQNTGSALRTLLHTDRLHFSTILAESGLRINGREYSRLYTSLLQRVVGDMTYIAACLQDLRDANISPTLLKMLSSEQLQCKYDLLHTLRLAHDPNVIDQIKAMILKGDQSQETIAYELLELMLSDQEKSWALPALREQTPGRLLRKLEADFPQTSLPTSERILSILGRNSLQLTEYTRCLALRDAFKQNIDKELSQRILAFGYYPEPLLRQLAVQYVQREQPDNFQAWKEKTGYTLQNGYQPEVFLTSIDERIAGFPDKLPIMLLHTVLRAQLEGRDIAVENEVYHWMILRFPEHVHMLDPILMKTSA
jgi:hypothetical protein